jgi:cell division protein YceG involved in septum cleavage
VTLFRRLALVLLLCAMAAVAYVGINLNTPYAGFNQEAFVDLPKGTSARQMAAMLQNAGVIRTPGRS